MNRKEMIIADNERLGSARQSKQGTVSGVVGLLLFCLIVLNIIAVFSSISPSILQIEGYSDVLNIMLSSYVSPILVSAIIILILIKFPRPFFESIKENKYFIYTSIAVFLSIILSMVANDSYEMKVFFAGVNYLIVNLLFIVFLHHFRLNKYLPWVNWFLCAWIVIPWITFIFFPTYQQYFFLPFYQKYLTFESLEMNGFMDSRLVYGFWSGLSLIMLFNEYVYTNNKKIKLFYTLSIILVWNCLLLSQTRSVPFSLLSGLVILFLISNEKKRLLIKLSKWSVVLLLGGSVCILLSIYRSNAHQSGAHQSGAHQSGGSIIRPGYINFHDPTRRDLRIRFDQIIIKNWLFGRGKMVLIHVPEHKQPIQAHEVFVQLLVNYGIFTLLFFICWLVLLFRMLKNNSAKVLLAYVVVFSCFQPALGGSTNFFSPQELFVFIVIFILDSFVTRGKFIQEFS